MVCKLPTLFLTHTEKERGECRGDQSRFRQGKSQALESARFTESELEPRFVAHMSGRSVFSHT
jgi:hypothetical protein